jgi:hypothetical protein
MPSRFWALLLVLLGLQLPWIGRPPHYDEANFLVLARGAQLDVWRPHAIPINWQGTTETAFAVLSNPPGIAWWLAPVLSWPVPAQRLWMLLWLPVALWGAWQLGRRFLGSPEAGALLLMGSPIVLISGAALMPDAPLYALVLAGTARFLDEQDRGKLGLGGAFLLGLAALFRYSALPLPLVLAAMAFFAGRRWVGSFIGFLPIFLLCLHDLHAYGALHLTAMSSFQSVSNTPQDWLHKLAAALAMLGGAAALPLRGWSRNMALGALAGLLLGWPWGWAGATFCALGGAALVGSLRRRELFFWTVGGLLFLLSLRFVATRYWLPFLPAVVLGLHHENRWRWSAGIVTLLLGIALQADDAAGAFAQRAMVQRLLSGTTETGLFTGHWGLQWELEQRGWAAAEADSHPPPGKLLVRPEQSWPQSLELWECAPLAEAEAAARWTWLPRGYSAAGRANLHANWQMGDPPQRTILPWTFATDPYERVRLCRTR